MSAVTPTGEPSTATAAAVPPLEPPGVLDKSKGLETRPVIPAFPGQKGRA